MYMYVCLQVECIVVCVQVHELGAWDLLCNRMMHRSWLLLRAVSEKHTQAVYTVKRERERVVTDRQTGKQKNYDYCFNLHP